MWFLCYPLTPKHHGQVAEAALPALSISVLDDVSPLSAVSWKLAEERVGVGGEVAGGLPGGDGCWRGWHLPHPNLGGNRWSSSLRETSRVLLFSSSPGPLLTGPAGLSFLFEATRMRKGVEQAWNEGLCSRALSSPGDHPSPHSIVLRVLCSLSQIWCIIPLAHPCHSSLDQTQPFLGFPPRQSSE